MTHQDRVYDAEFSPDGLRVVTASEDKTARVWDASTGEPIGKPMTHQGIVKHAGFSPDGLRVVTASLETARVWDGSTGEPIGPPLRHGDPVLYASFSRDGQSINTCTSYYVFLWVESTSKRWKPVGRAWTQGIRFLSKPWVSVDVKGSGARKIRIAEAWTGNSMIVRDIDFDQPEEGLPELDGEPKELLEKYLKRFALGFKSENVSPDLVPTNLFTPTPSDDDPNRRFSNAPGVR